MDHRTSINEVHQFLENQRKERLESAVSLMDASDSQLKAILYEARLAQHSLVRGSIAELENTRKIESATLVLESRLDELSKSTLGSYINKSSEEKPGLRNSLDRKLKAQDGFMYPKGSIAQNQLDDLSRKLKTRKSGIDTAVKKLTQEAYELEEEELEELSKSTLGSYIRKASAAKEVTGNDLARKLKVKGKSDYGDGVAQRDLNNLARTDKNRTSGVGSAVKRLVKEALAELEASKGD